jgi:hypothetical protein
MTTSTPISILAAGSLGDCVLTLPALQFLQSRAKVKVFGTLPFQSLGSGLLGVEEVLPLDPLLTALYHPDAPPAVFPGDAVNEVFIFFKEKDDKLSQSLPKAFPGKIHWPSKSFEEFLKEERWAGSYWLDLAGWVPQPGAAPPTARLRISEMARNQGKIILGALDLDNPFIMHPGSGSPAKNAPLSFFRKAAEKITRESPKKVLVIWGEAEEKSLEEIRGTFSGMPRVQVLPQSLKLKELVSLLTQACGYLGNDSGVTQLASACGLKTFAVFNQTNSRIWAPQEGFILETLKTFYS